MKIMQFLTRTVWWAVPTIWLPVVCYFLSRSIAMGHTASEMTIMVLFGMLVWTLLEYTLHRFLFHIKTKSYWSALSLSLSLLMITLGKYPLLTLYQSQQGKHRPLPAPWMPPQAPHGWAPPRLPSSCHCHPLHPGQFNFHPLKISHLSF